MQRTVSIQVSEKERAKLEWVAGRQGKSSHGYLRGLMLRELAKHADPPDGFGIPRRESDED